ncbi:unnamed protein product [Nesidiocoris tenuis]|uniref:Uncharacterized protein n=1 Tax=Nesidiocoris tenuis TaxID=355587 RepID=A0A6H5GY31_9HEMI|nr:unnamed protein product [Nesidiocoris tenuis]
MKSKRSQGGRSGQGVQIGFGGGGYGTIQGGGTSQSRWSRRRPRRKKGPRSRNMPRRWSRRRPRRKKGAKE